MIDIPPIPARIGEAIPKLRTGDQVKENDRRENGMCTLRACRFGSPPEMDVYLTHINNQHGTGIHYLRWQDDDVPLHWLYLWWRE
jgi:hypothetical protein